MSPLIVIPTYISKPGHAEALIKCVQTLRASVDSEILLIDDGSPVSDVQQRLLPELREKFDGITTIEKEENTGFSSTVNIGLKIGLENNQDVCLVNQDIEFIEQDWLAKMIKSEGDVVGALLMYPNGIIQHAGIYFSAFTRNFDHRFCGSPPNLPAALEPCDCPVTGALQFIRHSVLEDVGLYDEAFKLGFEDVDFMIRAIQAGHRSVYNPEVKAIHHESLIRKEKNAKIQKWEGESYVTLIRKWQNVDFYGLVPTL